MKTNREKTYLILKLAFSAGAVLFALVQILGIWDMANCVAMPLLGFALLIQSIQKWRYRRGVGFLCLVAAAILLYCSVASLF
ncbi:MAG: hypothetical protein IKI97_10725 [Clostridia bacterium]|nr:hypothetical protein [Clostridia bacterium]